MSCVRRTVLSTLVASPFSAKGHLISAAIWRVRDALGDALQKPYKTCPSCTDFLPCMDFNRGLEKKQLEYAGDGEMGQFLSLP